MRHILIAAIFSVAAGAAAFAQAPAPKPDANAEHPPTNRMDQVVPAMKAPGGQELAPTNRIDQAVPPMKSTDAQSAGKSTQAGSLVPDAQWIGRSVYSSDGKKLGKVASVTKNGNQGAFTVDMGGFLGLGAKPTLIQPNQIQEATEQRIVLNLTEAAAENLPSNEDAQKPTEH
jgi:PRC-barrel domain